MLIDITVGKLDNGNQNGNWVQTKDRYDNIIFENKAIKQIIRFFHVGYRSDDDTKYIGDASSSSLNDGDVSIDVYKINDGIKIERNPKNMSMLVTKNDIKSKMHYMYFTIDSSKYTLIDYSNNDSEIVKTYKKKSMYQGALFTVSVDMIESIYNDKESIPILRAILKKHDVNDEIFAIDIVYNVNRDTFDVEYYSIYSPYELYTYIHKFKDMGGKFFQFKISDTEGIPTSALIVSEKYSNSISESDIGEGFLATSDIIVVTDSEKAEIENKTYKKDKALMEKLKVLSSPKVQAVTTCGVKLDKNFLIDHSIWYLFRFDQWSHVSTILRSA